MAPTSSPSNRITTHLQAEAAANLLHAVDTEAILAATPVGVVVAVVDEAVVGEASSRREMDHLSGFLRPSCSVLPFLYILPLLSY